MTVYVDNARHRYGRMRMCHMVADSTAELLAMVDRIGLNRRWIQKVGTYQEHFDVSLTKRALAVAAGAVEISQRELGSILVRRRRDQFSTTAESLPLNDLPSVDGEFGTTDADPVEDFKRCRSMGGTAIRGEGQ